MDLTALDEMSAEATKAGRIKEVEKSYTANDSGNAKRFVDKYGDEIRFVPELGKWLVWSGQRWVTDKVGAVARMAQEHARQVFLDTAQIVDDDRRKREATAAINLGNAPKLLAMQNLARHDERVVILQEQLDADPFLLGVKNGVIDLNSGSFRAGQRGDYVTKVTGADFVEDAKCPMWDEFLRVALRDDESLIRYIQKAVGYTLSGAIVEHCFFFLYGGGCNGKSTFVETIQSLAGEYGQHASQELFMTSANGREPTQEIARLAGVRSVVGSETEEGSRFAESRIKELTGGDTLTGRHLYQAAFDFKPTFKFWLFGNHKPTIRGNDRGIWRRVHMVPFLAQITEEQKDRGLRTKLLSEMPGIFNWAIEGFQLYRNEGLTPPKVVAAAVAEYREDEDLLGEFLADRTVDDPKQRVERGELYSSYTSWCNAEGIGRPMTNRNFCKKLRERSGFTNREAKCGDSRYWAGLALRRQENGISFTGAARGGFTSVEAPTGLN